MAVGDGRRHSPPPSRASALIHLKVASRKAPAGTPCLLTDSETGFPTILSNWLREIVLSPPEAARTTVVKLIIGALVAGGGHVTQAFLALTQRLGARNRGCGSASDRVRFWRTSRGHGFWQRRNPQRPVIPTAADHFHHPRRNAVKNRPLIGTDQPPLV